MNSNYFQYDSDTRSTSYNNIEAIIKCYICLGKIKNPCMCPSCQKLTCEECIEKWLSEKKSQCPHCRVNLNFNQLIHLSFMTDVANYIDKISSSKKAEESEICEKHGIQNLYYCIECETPLCSDCYMLEENHKKHKIKKIDEVFRMHLDMIKQEKEGLDIEENTLKKYLKDIGDKIIEIGNNKYKKIKETEEFFKNIREQIQVQSQEVINNLFEKKKNLENKLSEIHNYSKNINFRIKNSSKNDIINQSNNLIKNLKEIKLKILTSNSDTFDEKIQNNLTLNIINPLVPKYETGTFVIKNYEKIKSEKIMYSPEMRINGLVWKLKLYPRGNVTSKGECISVFLELQSGVIEPSKYYYVLEMVNFKNRRNYFMEYSSNFSNGECWGYSNFYKINKLKEDGFINQDGNIIIKVHIRPESFEQLSKDLKGYINYLEKKNKKKEEIIGEENEEEDEDEDIDFIGDKKMNITKNNSLKDLKYANDFFKDLSFEHTKNNKKCKNKENKNIRGINKSHSFVLYLYKNNNDNNDKKIGKNKNNNTSIKLNEDNKKIEKGKGIIASLSLNDMVNINTNFNKQNILFKSDIKKNFDNNEINKNLNVNNINNINSIMTEPELKKIDLKDIINKANNNINININNNINNINDINKKKKLCNLAKIDISLDSDEEQKKTNEDPFLIPKKRPDQFIMDDDSIEYLVDSIKFNDDKKDKNNNNMFDELKNSMNFQYQDLKKNLEKKKNKDKDGRGRNNYERNYLPYRNNYNYYGNGNTNGQSNSNSNNNINYNDNSGNIKFPNELDNYKKKYYK